MKDAETSKRPGLPLHLHEHFMRMALREAKRARDAEEVPTGCVIAKWPRDPSIMPAAMPAIARAHNQTRTLNDPTAHAEMIAITQAASAMSDWRLTETVLYVTKEPCPMCAGAIILARIPLVVYGMPDRERGGISLFNILDTPSLNHRSNVISGVMEAPCREMMRTFFRERRKKTD